MSKDVSFLYNFPSEEVKKGMHDATVFLFNHNILYIYNIIALLSWDH